MCALICTYFLWLALQLLEALFKEVLSALRLDRTFLVDRVTIGTLLRSDELVTLVVQRFNIRQVLLDFLDDSDHVDEATYGQIGLLFVGAPAPLWLLALDLRKEKTHGV